MDYRITIVRTEKNPEYKPQRPDPYYSQKEPEHSQFLEYRVFEMELKEEEFNAIRRGVLEKVI